MIGQDTAYRAAVELVGTLDGARSDLRDARQELVMTTREHVSLSTTLRAKLADIGAWLLDVEGALRGAEDEASDVCNLISPDAEAIEQLRNLARLVLDVDRGIADADELRRRALEVAGDLVEAL